MTSSLLMDKALQILPKATSIISPHSIDQSIAEFSGGTHLRITEVRGDDKLCHRLQTMGIYPGRQVQVLRRRGNSVTIKHGHMSLGLRLSSDFDIQAVAL